MKPRIIAECYKIGELINKFTFSIILYLMPFRRLITYFYVNITQIKIYNYCKPVINRNDADEVKHLECNIEWVHLIMFHEKKNIV